MDDMDCTKTISAEMFGNTDIEDIEICNEHIFVVKLRGINGTIPASFFTDKAKDKIRSYAKIRNSELWKALNVQ